MIEFSCSQCGKGMKVPPDKAGSRGRCPRCGAAVVAPAVSMAATIPSRGSSRKGRTKEAPSRDQETDFLDPPQQPDEIGRLGGRYRVLKVLGSGGMGVVFLAEDTKLRRHVALKAMKTAIASDPVHRGRFVQEARAIANIDHDNIVPIYDVYDTDDRGVVVPYFSMKLLVGESLEARLVRQKYLPAEQVARIGMEIADGLAAAHEKGTIHRDIKPANIWLEEGRDRVKLLDFGLAFEEDDDDARKKDEGLLIGTPHYMSPEQATGDSILDARTDLFSLGVVLYRMTTGELPFKGKTTLNLLTALATVKPKAPHKVRPEVPRGLSAYVMTLLAKDPDDRPRNARLVIAGLADLKDPPPDDEIVEEVAVEEEPEEEEPEPEPPPEPTPPPKRRPPRGKKRPPSKFTDDELAARKAIRFAIFAGVCVFLLLTFMVVRNAFFKKEDPPPTPPPAGTGLAPAIMPDYREC